MVDRGKRLSARVVIVDNSGSALLFRIVDTMAPRAPVWITPGGGVEPGESLAQAAARELLEETGERVEPRTLREPIARCRDSWEFRGHLVHSEDWFFALRADRFVPNTDGWSDLEHEVHASWRWWTREELETTNEAIRPMGFARLVRDIALGRVFDEAVELS